MIYIKQADASFIVKGMVESGDYVDKRRFVAQYGGSLTDSIQISQYKKISPKKAIRKIGHHLYCDDFISVTFKRGYSEVDEQTDQRRVIMNKLALRNHLYAEGFTCEGIKYVKYERSSGSARVGTCLFINEKYHDKMVLFSNMGIKFEEGEECDIASLFAYQTLTLSTKIGEIDIQPEEILLIDDVNTKFITHSSVTEINDKGKLTVIEKMLEQGQDLWDGQTLLEASMYTGEYVDKSMLLLRNHFYKSACFKTYIQKFFSEHGITTVTDMFGREMDATKIKMITTPNSVKALKFAYKLGKNKNKERKMYDYWRSKLVPFGIVKYEKPSKFGRYNRTSYQMINSLPLTREDVAELMREETDYVGLINSNVPVFKHRIGVDEPRNNYSYMMKILSVTDAVKNTRLYKNGRKKVVDSHKTKLFRGKIRLKNTDYFTMLSMPMEMLEQAAFGSYTPLMEGYQIYTKYFKDGEEVTGFRNPHVNSGNVAIFKNVYKEEFDKYFSLSENIVVINCWDNDVTNRLQGADFDSDTVLLTSNAIILKRAKEISHHPTPVNGISASKLKRHLTHTEASEVDNIISNNEIGPIINLSQIFNSYYWSTTSEEKKQIYYNASSKLSSMSQVEIDKAKKLFDFSMTKAINQIKKDSGVNFKIKPNFFKHVVENPSACEFMSFETPMDYVIEEVGNIRPADRSKNIKVSELLKYNYLNGSKGQIKRLVSEAEKVKSALDTIYSKKEGFEQIPRLTEGLEKAIAKKTITPETLCALLVGFEGKLSHVKNMMMKAIDKIYPELLIEVFNKGEVSLLEEDDLGGVVIFSKKYKVIKVNNEQETTKSV